MNVHPTLAETLAALKAAEAGSNELDNMLAVAVFAPDDVCTAARLNNAGTKMILTLRSGKESTTVAGDLTTRADPALHLMEEALPGWTYAVDASAPESGIDALLFGPAGQRVQGTSAPTLPLALCVAVVEAVLAGRRLEVV